MRVVAALAVVLVLGGCAMGTPEYRVDQTYTFGSDVTRLVLRAQSARVDVQVHDGPLRIDEVRTWHDSAHKPLTTRTVDGSTLTVTATGCADGDGCDAGLVIMVPSSVTLDVRIEAGHLGLQDIAGELTAVVTTGEIDGDDLRSTMMTVSVETGSIDLRSAVPPTRLVAAVTTGELTVRVPDSATYAVNSDGTVEGDADIDVHRDPSSAHVLQLKVDTGSLSVRNT